MVAGCAAAARADIVLGPAAISATVRDAAGKPVAGARVVAYGAAEREALTGTAGVATLQALPLGSYAVRVTRGGFEPYDVTVRVSSASAPTAVAVRLTTGSLDRAAGALGTALATGVPLGAGSDPFAAHALLSAPGTGLVASAAGAGTGIVIDGAAPGESRVELDGIPIAGGAQGYNALRFRNALPLADVAVARGPLPGETTVRDAIGGVVDYRTPPFAEAFSGGIDAGYDSAFGAFTHARFSDTLGSLGVSVDDVAGGGQNRAQTLEARYALSSDVSLAVASYGSQSDAVTNGASVTSDAPAFAADARASVGSGTLQVRSFSSEAHTHANGAMLENARVRGLQVAYDVPDGRNLFGFAFDRRAEDTGFADGSTSSQTFHTFTVRGDVVLAARARLAFADSFEGGTTFAPRSDPRADLAFRASDRWTLHIAAGSAFATESASLFSTAALADTARAPESSFGLRARADGSFGGGFGMWVAAFQTRRFDRFGGAPNGRTEGLEAGFDRPAHATGLGADAYLDLERGNALAPGTVAFDAIPALKAHAAVRYRLHGVGLDLGTTLLGADNAFSTHAITLGDAALFVPVRHVAVVRLGIENAFGARAAAAPLLPLFAPREFTLTIGPAFSPSGGPGR